MLIYDKGSIISEKGVIMRYVFIITIVISLAFIGSTTLMEIVKINEHLLLDVYKEDVSALFFLDRNSSFYNFYSLREASTYFIIRKIGHFLAYGFLAGIIFLVLPVNRLWVRALLASGSATLIGLVDEVHQHFLINRSGRILDVFINAAGSVFAVLILVTIFIFIRWVKKLLKAQNLSKS